ncbi:hypothetical protein PLESTF_001258400 [Pleodorina starrii]|nr:hypothetical protein PLESTM_000444300 [Pleodorina starrii]GLC72506.1 hypothetical protein PLESTF_001258400 [Pleodorina starrii]
MATLRQIQPFTGRRLSSVAVPCRTRVVKVQCLNQQSKQSAGLYNQEAKAGSNLPLAISVALGSIGLIARTAFAEEVVSQSAPTISPEDVEILAASSSGSGIDQVLVSLLFGVVVLLLVVLTGGVAYMNISQWLDNRQEKEDRDKATKDVALGSTASEAKSDTDGGEVISLKRASRIKKEKGKGFAAAEFTSRR